LVTDYTNNVINQYDMSDSGMFTAPTQYLPLGAGATPTYMLEFTSTVAPHFAATPEPASIALLGLGAAAGLIARRRRRRTSAG
jgi:hypothetical protein